jgi:hypothetical protein
LKFSFKFNGIKKSRPISFVWNVAWLEQEGKADKALVGISGTIGPLGRIRPKWEDNIKLGLKEEGISCIGFSWTRLGQSGRFF